ncbi:MAG: hypothetical protein GC134_05825 [Proteobacteria bacterium]|nr:hypothetical protein [Pseudomonadota bacterium]
MFDWFNDLPGWVKVISLTLLAIGYMYGQIEAARSVMRIFERRAREKKVTEWQATTRAAISVIGHGAAATFVDDNVVMLVPVLDAQNQPTDYVVMHKVLTALNHDHKVASEVIPTTDLNVAQRRYKELATQWLADGKRVDGRELLK